MTKVGCRLRRKEDCTKGIEKAWLISTGLARSANCFEIGSKLSRWMLSQKANGPMMSAHPAHAPCPVLAYEEINRRAGRLPLPLKAPNLPSDFPQGEFNNLKTFYHLFWLFLQQTAPLFTTVPILNFVSN